MAARPLDDRLMQGAIDEAKKGVGRTSPNPAVGAVLADGLKILARGHHRAAGSAHAEIECLRAFGMPVPKPATLYVTLEPCSTAGSTPPCTEALLKAGVKRVVVGAIDPNPVHAGRGIELLRKEGVEVVVGVLASECTDLNQAFNKWILHKRPLVIAKCGMTLDGRLTRPPNEQHWITSSSSRRHANRIRAQVDAILVGAETLRADNPRLSVRGRASGPQPWRIVLTRSGRLPKSAHVFTDRFATRTLVFREQSLTKLFDSLGERAITSVLMEGGGQILGQALDAQLIDRVHIYLAPMFTSGPVMAFPGEGASATLRGLRLDDIRYERIGTDIFVSGKAKYGPTASE